MTGGSDSSMSTASSPCSLSPDDVASLSSAPIANFGGLEYRDTSSDKYRVAFVLGGPGAGKGTQSALLIDRHDYPCVHLSAGELLRQEAAKPDTESEHAGTIRRALAEGSIVPVEISLSLLRGAMQTASLNDDGDSEGGHQQVLFLIDGFPRNFDNLEGWFEYMPPTTDLVACLVYQCPLAVLQKRILERSKEQERTDDNLETLKRRFETFQRESMPVVDLLEQYVITINGNDELDAVWTRTKAAVDDIMKDYVLTQNAALLRAVRDGDFDAYQKLCHPDWFVTEEGDDDDGGSKKKKKRKKNPRDVMTKQEGKIDANKSGGNDVLGVSNAEYEVITGRQIAIAYDREFEGELVREKRFWSHRGDLGWRNVHFQRTPPPSRDRR